MWLSLISGFILASVLAYILYYFTKLLSPVRLYFINTEKNNAIIQKCSLLRGKYWPSPWVFNCHLQGVILMKLRKKVDPGYRREVITASDGASLELDWGECDGPELKPDSPVILLLSGVTGNSSSSYIMYLSVAFRKRGYRPVIMNYPNATGSPLTSPRFFCLDSVSDTKEYVEHVDRLYPNAKKIGIGFSLGGFFMTKYIQEVPKNPLSGVMVLSCPFNAAKCLEAWEGRWIHQNVYDKHFLEKFKGGFERNQDTFRQLKELDFDLILRSTCMEELHRSLSFKLYNVDTMEAYHDIMSCDQKLDKIEIPLLSLHAWNDPVIAPCAIPAVKLKSNPNIIFAATFTGGHTGWLSGLTPWKSLAWCEELALQYTDTILSLDE